MAEETRRYQPVNGEEEPLELNDVLEPYDPAEPASFYGDDPYQQPEPLDEYDPAYDPNQAYDEEYSDYHEELDRAGRLHTAMGIFDTVSTLVGAVVILVLMALLFSMVSWLKNDILHSLALLKSGIQ